MKRIIIFSVFFLTSIFVRAPIYGQESLKVLESFNNTDIKNGKVIFFSETPYIQSEKYTNLTLDSPYVGSVNGWEYWDDSFFSQGIFTEVGSYFSDKYNQSGQTFYHKGKSVQGITSDSLFLMNTHFKKRVEEFTLPREFWIHVNLDFIEGDAFPWFDLNIWYEDGPHYFFGLFMLGIGYGTPWDSVTTANTFVLKMPDSYYQTSIDSGWVFHGLDINIMSSLVTAQPYIQELGFWFSGIEAVYYDDNQQDTTIVVLDDFLVTSYNDDEEIVPSEFSLSQNYPNPFNPTTTIEFSLLKSGDARIDIYSMLGEHVLTIVDGYYTSGNHRISVDFSKNNLPSGVYVYTLTSSQKILSKKMLFLK